ncbi:hypothetical protein Nepgr_023973 [Nepenthes gracilis]|uniref:Uncharacterized protein n=1 Tax=Nepenthes gracilis TaxID=150966 RepID=A0AAD3T2C4_NEPGR|nr:hypothetical protein Nepgr_023973 [Nepenthes gracilis]
MLQDHHPNTLHPIGDKRSGKKDTKQLTRDYRCKIGPIQPPTNIKRWLHMGASPIKIGCKLAHQPGRKAPNAYATTGIHKLEQQNNRQRPQACITKIIGDPTEEEQMASHPERHSAVPKGGLRPTMRNQVIIEQWSKLKVVQPKFLGHQTQDPGEAAPKTPYPSCIDGNGI